MKNTHSFGLDFMGCDSRYFTNRRKARKSDARQPAPLVFWGSGLGWLSGSEQHPLSAYGSLKRQSNLEEIRKNLDEKAVPNGEGL